MSPTMDVFFALLLAVPLYMNLWLARPWDGIAVKPTRYGAVANPTRTSRPRAMNPRCARARADR